MIKRYIIHLALISLLFISISCGKGGDGGGTDAPYDAIITINPPDGILFDSLSGDAIVPITAVVKTAKGVPLEDVELFISGSLAEPRVPARYQFYRDFNAGDPTPSGFSAATNENGVYQFSIKIYGVVGGSPSVFTDTISIHAQSVFASIPVELGTTTTP